MPGGLSTLVAVVAAPRKVIVVVWPAGIRPRLRPEIPARRACRDPGCLGRIAAKRRRVPWQEASGIVCNYDVCERFKSMQIRSTDSIGKLRQKP